MVGWEPYRNQSNPSYTVSEFFEYLHNNGKMIPFLVTEVRWKAMLKWLNKRQELKDWIVNEQGNKE